LNLFKETEILRYQPIDTSIEKNHSLEKFSFQVLVDKERH
jgi:hypothetical protein